MFLAEETKLKREVALKFLTEAVRGNSGRLSRFRVKAKAGCRVEGLDLRLFINHLPDGRPVHIFRTDNASGSTSQAASIIEALEMNAHALVLDEDTCNHAPHDSRRPHAGAGGKKGDPITPFIDRVRSLVVSSVMVLGDSGDYFDVADTVIRMDRYLPMDVTSRPLLSRNSIPRAGSSMSWKRPHPRGNPGAYS